jgi:hypothetical protein
VSLSGESSNHEFESLSEENATKLLESLEEWNNYLEANAPSYRDLEPSP